MKIKVFALAIGLVIGAVSGIVAAGVNEKMTDMFGAQSNFTRPGSAQGATRGVITGGGVALRNPIVSPSGFAFDPPSASAGCGGIDMYGGNLSFPSKEQYIATARAVVGNVGGYAFKSALKFVCEACESVMSAIQETVTTLNVDNMNSCQIAQGVVNGVKDGSLRESMSNAGDNVATSWKQAGGDVRDYFEGFNAGAGKERPSKAAAEDPEMSKIFQGNWTWDSMEKTQAFDWLGSDKRTREEIMTLLGTVVTCVPGVGECKEVGEQGPVPSILEPKLRLHDFVAIKAQSSELQVYTCNDPGCLSVNLTSERELGTSVSQKIIDTLLGSTDAPGVLQRMVMSGKEAGVLTPNEKVLIENTSDLTSLAAACMSAGEQGQGYARILVEGLAPMVAADALYRGADQSLTLMIADLANRGTAIGAPQAAAMLRTTRADLRNQRDEIRATTESHDMLALAIQRCGKSTIAAASYGIAR